MGLAKGLALYEKIQGALRLFALDEQATAQGFYPGQALTEARAIEPSLVAAPADPESDERDFRALCAALTRYSPFVGQFAHNAFLDVTGAAHLFGGEAALIDDACARLKRLGFSARGAIADSPGAAYAAAHYGRIQITPSGGAREMLKDLPVAALRLDDKTAETLRRLGLKRIGQLYDLPRAPLTARLGPMLMRRLAQALALEDEPITPLFPLPDYAAAAPLVEPIVSAEAILICLEKLTRDLERLLERDGKGGRRFELALYRVDGRVTRIAVGAARAERQPAVLLRLFKDRLADIHDDRDAGFGYDLLKLSAFACAPYASALAATFDAPAREGDLAALVARLANRLGSDQVCALSFENAHMPERSARLVPVSSSPLALSSPPLARSARGSASERRRGGAAPRVPSLELSTDAAAPSQQQEPDSREESRVASVPYKDVLTRGNTPPLPFSLLPAPEAIEAVASVPDGPPMRFTWRRVPYVVKKASGAERIAGDWRRPQPEKTRDYYRVEDERGRRFWLYREGLFGDDAPPKWFLHGFI